MFSGIIETTSNILEFKPRYNVYELVLSRPSEFDDLCLGDSVAVNGVCLTVEKLTSDQITFAVADETLRVTKWERSLRKNSKVNLERSLRLGDRIHGHLVQGHVDGMAEVTAIVRQTESLFLTVRLPEVLLPFVWKKGSITLNGVSLTINRLEERELEVCLIPETLKRTNLGELKAGDDVTCEADTLARYYERSRELERGMN